MSRQASPLHARDTLLASDPSMPSCSTQSSSSSPVTPLEGASINSISIGGIRPRPSRPKLARLDTTESAKQAQGVGRNVVSAHPGHALRHHNDKSRTAPGSPSSRRTSPVAFRSADLDKVVPLHNYQLAKPGPSHQKRRESEPMVDNNVVAAEEPPKQLRPVASPTRSFSVSSGMLFSASFEPSEMIDGFLYVGPEIATTSEADYLRKQLRVQCIINAAEEIEMGGGKHLSLDDSAASGFAKYVKIPLRDCVDAVDVQRHMDETCALLDQARTDDMPVYIHCKAGKSRSVMLVMAYLIHSRHWTLQTAYAYVVERRRDISPNIGFVAELMAFEERTLTSSSRQTAEGTCVVADRDCADDATGPTRPAL